MARLIWERITIAGQLVALSALHVGGAGADPATDLPLVRDGQGWIYMPGTSLAGVLRNWCEQSLGTDVAASWWGPRFERGSKEGHASLVLVEDAPIDAGFVEEIRDGVGIDRQWGTAARAIKYDRAVLPAGTALPFHLTLDVPVGQNGAAAMAMLRSLIEALETRKIRLGAGVTRGLGQVVLRQRRVRRETFDNPDDLLARIARGQASGAEIVNLDQLSPAPQNLCLPPQLAVALHWQPDGPVSSRAGYDGIAVDALPLVTARFNDVALVLPGSGIKGVLRAQAERILRTVHQGLPLGDEPEPLRRFLVQMSAPLIDGLFGARRDDVPDKACGPLPGKAALSVADCHALKRIDKSQWAEIEESIALTALPAALARAGLAGFTPAVHVAVDRWTGGAAEQLLFSGLEPRFADPEKAWEPIALTLDFERLALPDRLPGLALLLLTLRDFREGRVPLGFAVNRGMGALKVTRTEYAGSGLQGSDPAELGLLERRHEDLEMIKPLPAPLKAALAQAWQHGDHRGSNRSKARLWHDLFARCPHCARHGFAEYGAHPVCGRARRRRGAALHPGAMPLRPDRRRRDAGRRDGAAACRRSCVRGARLLSFRGVALAAPGRASGGSGRSGRAYR